MSISYSEVMKSPSEVSSRSVSPVVLRPATTPHQKQRSSSMNSVGSTHSTHHRSMSMVSSESPRNSIVSVDDFFLKPTRNNSSSSLASLGVANAPWEPKESHPLVSRLQRIKTKNGCAVVSDDESSEPEHVLTRSSVWRRRRSSDKVHKPDFLMSFKNNFKFKYDNYVKPKGATSPGGVSANVPAAAKIDDPMPSPLSLAVEGPHTYPFHSPENELPPAARPPTTPSTKKVRSSSMTQSMFLKRKLLLSKDIQFELLSSHASTTVAYPTSINNTGNSHGNTNEIRSPSHFLSQQAPSRGSANGDSPSMENPPSSPPNLHVVKSPSPQGSPLSPQSLISLGHSISPPTEQTLRQQNKLITELNRKWNRAMYSPSMDEYSQHDSSLEYGSGRSAKKRGRSESTSSTDSVVTNY